MAGISECFSIGSTVSCTTCFKQVIEGDVLAFDPSTKMLVLSILFSIQHTIESHQIRIKSSRSLIFIHFTLFHINIALYAYTYAHTYTLIHSHSHVHKIFHAHTVVFLNQISMNKNNRMHKKRQTIKRYFHSEFVTV